MTQKILHASGAFTANASGATQVGGGALDDSSDASYIEGTSSNGILGYTVGLDALSGYVSGDAITLHIRLSLTGDGEPVDASAQVFISPDASPDLTEVGGFSDGSDSGFGFVVPVVDGTIQDLVVPLSMGAWSTTEADVVAALEAGAFLEVNAVVNRNAPGSFVSRVYEAWVTVGEDTVDLPCDTDVALDLSSAVFMVGDDGPLGQYVDGVICARDDVLTFPDFYFPGIVLDETKRYKITVTYDPTSPHDSGDRGVWLSQVDAGDEQASWATTAEFADLGINGDNTGTDVVRITVQATKPGENIWFETDVAGAVSAITIRKLCTFAIPPLRLTNRDDLRLTGRRSQQGSARLTGYL